MDKWKKSGLAGERFHLNPFIIWVYPSRMGTDYVIHFGLHSESGDLDMDLAEAKRWCLGRAMALATEMMDKLSEAQQRSVA